MLLNVHKKPQGLLGTGRREGGGMEVGEREIIYISLHCHHQNDFCIRWAAMRTVLMFH